MSKIGIICEDQSDLDVFIPLMKSIVKKFEWDKKFGEGCSQIKRKSDRFSQELVRKGCGHILVVVDLDENHGMESKMKSDLEKLISGCGATSRAIVIPVKEIEAWILSDGEAIKRGLGLKGSVKDTPSPEFIEDPKQRLEEIVARASKNTLRYENTSHNKKISPHLDINKLRKRKSFRELEMYLRSIN